MIDLPSQITKLPDKEDDFSQVAEKLPQNLEDPEAVPYVISFERYNEKMCQIVSLDSNKARRAIEILKLIGTKISCAADFQRFAIDRSPVRKYGEYKKLYRGLAEDIELREIRLQQNARIFYFDIEPERKFYIVAITQNHLETKKVRR